MLLPALLSQELLERALVPEGDLTCKICRIKTRLCCPVWDEGVGGAIPRTPTDKVSTHRRPKTDSTGGMPALQTDLLKQPGPSEENQLLALIIAYVFVARARKISTGKYTFHQNAFG